MLSTTHKLWLDYDVVAQVKPVSLHRHQAVVVSFVSWALRENLNARSPDDLDDALSWYN